MGFFCFHLIWENILLPQSLPATSFFSSYCPMGALLSEVSPLPQNGAFSRLRVGCTLSNSMFAVNSQVFWSDHGAAFSSSWVKMKTTASGLEPYCVVCVLSLMSHSPFFCFCLACPSTFMWAPKIILPFQIFLYLPEGKLQIGFSSVSSCTIRIDCE